VSRCVTKSSARRKEGNEVTERQEELTERLHPIRTNSLQKTGEGEKTKGGQKGKGIVLPRSRSGKRIGLAGERDLFCDMNQSDPRKQNAQTVRTQLRLRRERKMETGVVISK